jgi:hypothetical protein
MNKGTTEAFKEYLLEPTLAIPDEPQHPHKGPKMGDFRNSYPPKRARNGGFSGRFLVGSQKTAGD